MLRTGYPVVTEYIHPRLIAQAPSAELHAIHTFSVGANSNPSRGAL